MTDPNDAYVHLLAVWAKRRLTLLFNLLAGISLGGAAVVLILGAFAHRLVVPYTFLFATAACVTVARILDGENVPNPR